MTAAGLTSRGAACHDLRVRGSLSVLLFVASGCGLLLDLDPPRGADDGATRDGGRAVDAGRTDAGRRDAGRADAGARDAGGGPDRLDATKRDGGRSDAGRRDAGTRDAGRRDAGCPEVPCRLLPPQCGCGELACNYDPDTLEIGCFPPGPGGSGDSCLRETDCARGHTCSYVAGVRRGVCRPFCTDDVHCSAVGSSCVGLSDHEGRPLPVGACSSVCTPGSPTGCPAGMVCDVVRFIDASDDVVDVAFCRSAGSGGTLEACGTPEACDADHSCLGGRCLRRCRAGEECPGGAACVEYEPPLIYRGVGYGLCDG